MVRLGIVDRVAGLLAIVLGASLFGAAGCAPHAGVATAARERFDPHASSPAQRARLDALRAALAPVVASRKDPEALLLLDHDALYAPLDAEQRALLDEIRHQPGADPSVSIPEDVVWTRLEGQVVHGPTGDQPIPLQLVTEPVGRALRELDRAMRRDLGRGLLVGSAYRSPAYQLQLIVDLLPRFGYSLEQTIVHVSLPGASDHNRVDRLGVDFVSESGIDLAWADAAAFRALPEYAWLVEHAKSFGFEADPAKPGELPTSPWHWRYADER
ncbi:MAG: D-alanyl-D-alanine carboxypeptidase family protein [Deltaproteobacteria bacterium]|nr:D-alanyl-D-alanine carboxypeptidase family protein [Deltaproteobacteria bacterium]